MLVGTGRLQGGLVETRKNKLMEHEMKSSIFADWEVTVTHCIRKAKLTPSLYARPSKKIFRR